MRKITSKFKEERKKKRNGVIIGLILVGIMVFSVLGYSFLGEEKNNNTEKIVYNNFEFENVNGFWTTKINGIPFAFKYNPTQINETESNLTSLDYYNKPLYISSENKEAESEIYRNLFYQNQIVQRMQYACLEGEVCEGDFPVKTCEDNFVIIKEANESKIIQKDNCVFIEGKQEDLTKISDEFLYRIFGIR